MEMESEQSGNVLQGFFDQNGKPRMALLADTIGFAGQSIGEGSLDAVYQLGFSSTAVRNRHSSIRNISYVRASQRSPTVH